MKKELWNYWYPQAKAFYQEKGHLRPSRNGEDGKLAWWIDSLRKDFVQGKLSSEEILALEEIGMAWDPRAVDWEMKTKALKAYVEEYGNIAPRRGEVYDGVDLGNLIHSLKNQYREGSLAKARQEALEELGIVFGDSKPVAKKPGEREMKNWQYKYSLAVKFVEEFGHLYIPAGYQYCNEKMGDWLNTQRRNYKNGVLSDYAIAKLEALGVDWTPGQKRKPQVPQRG